MIGADILGRMIPEELGRYAVYQYQKETAMREVICAQTDVIDILKQLVKEQDALSLRVTMMNDALRTAQEYEDKMARNYYEPPMEKA